MKGRNPISTVAGILSILGVLVSATVILKMVADELKVTELSLSALSVGVGLGVGLLSNYIVGLARKIRRAPRVFLSYSHGTGVLAKNVAQALRSQGARVWLDVEQIEPGADITTAVRRALEETDTFIALVSRESSPNFEFECDLARKGGVRILPVLAEQAAMPAQLEGVQYIDLRPNEQQGIETLVRAAT